MLINNEKKEKIREKQNLSLFYQQQISDKNQIKNLDKICQIKQDKSSLKDII